MILLKYRNNDLDASIQPIFTSIYKIDWLIECFGLTPYRQYSSHVIKNSKQLLHGMVRHILKFVYLLLSLIQTQFQKQTFELQPEHRFSPNNIHAIRISEPCILPVFCKVNQAVGYKPLKHLYIQLIHLFDCYIYTFIHITWI